MDVLTDTQRKFYEDWAHQLETTNDVQGKGHLYQVQDGVPMYCVLGEACKMLDIPLVDSANNVDSNSGAYDALEPYLVHDAYFYYCLNDRADQTFSQIAAIIRKDILKENPENA